MPGWSLIGEVDHNTHILVTRLIQEMVDQGLGTRTMHDPPKNPSGLVGSRSSTPSTNMNNALKTANLYRMSTAKGCHCWKFRPASAPGLVFKPGFYPLASKRLNLLLRPGTFLPLAGIRNLFRVRPLCAA